MNQYTPRPGSVAERALHELQARGARSGSDLSDAIDVETTTLAPCLKAAIDHGLLRRDQRNGVWWYDLGDGTAPPPAAEAAKADQRASVVWPQVDGSQKPDGAAAIPRAKAGRNKPKFTPKTATDLDDALAQIDAAQIPEGREAQHVLKAEGDGPDATDRATPAMTSPRVGAMGASQPADAGAPAESIRIALWSDGQLHVRRPGGHLVVFQREETRLIVAYLDSIALDAVREEASA